MSLWPDSPGLPQETQLEQAQPDHAQPAPVAPERNAGPPQFDASPPSVSPRIAEGVSMGLEGAYGAQWQEPYGTTVGRTLTGATPAEAFPPATAGGDPAMREALATTFSAGHPGSDHPEMQAVLRGALADGMPQADRALVNGAALDAIVARDPEALIDTRALPREHLEAWQDLARRRLSGEIRVEMDTMNARTLREHRQSGAFGPVAVSDTWGRQSVYDARGGTVNMDYYAVRVDRMPRGVTPEQMLRDIRTSNFSTVTDRQESTFEGYGTGQVARAKIFWIERE